MKDKPASADVLILGMGFHFPGSIQTAEALWSALADGKDLTGPPSDHRSALMPGADQDYPKQAGYLNSPELFDAAFFGVKGLEAHHMDPNQRLLLETTWWAFEDAGLPPSQLKGSDTAVFVGAHAFDYRDLCLQASEVNAYWNLGLNGAVLSNRLSWYFDFTGPSQTINTACSSGLAALDAAVSTLQSGRSSYALAAGVNLILTPAVSISAARAGMLSPTGTCKTFDAGADGFVRGEGACTLLLGLDNAKRPSGTQPYARIRASRTCHGGRATSLTTPNLARMRDLLVNTYKAAELTFDQIDYLETHGTGTRLGDAVEADALIEASEIMGAGNTTQCILGSIKTNFGHLEAAAGLAGVIKVCLAMRQGLRPGLVHFSAVNPMIDFSTTCFQLCAKSTPWPQGDHPRRAGVSSFGFGGALAHVILEQAETIAYSEEKTGPWLLPLSARNQAALDLQVRQLYQFIQNPQLPPQAIAAALQLGREAMSERLAIVCTGHGDLCAKLKVHLEGRATEGLFRGSAPKRRRGKQEPLPMPDNTQALAQYWVKGGSVDWADFYNNPPLQARLPQYPFIRKRYWICDLNGA